MEIKKGLKNAKLTEVKTLSPTTNSFIFELEKKTDVHFKAGQFITFDLPISEKKTGRLKSYSIASEPGNSEGKIELCIGRIEGGKASDFFFNEIEIGDILNYRGPHGKFYLSDEITNKMVFICTGTGIAPVRSIILNLLNQKHITCNIHLIYGCRFENEILYRKDFELLKITNSNFKYDICLSREKNWAGYKGYVHQVYLEYYSMKNQNISFFLCGWGSMIGEAKLNLFHKLKVPKDQVTYEMFGLSKKRK